MKNRKMNGEWVAIKPDPARTMHPINGVHIPESAQRLDDFHTGTVLFVGEGFDGAPITNVKPGDTVTFQSQLGTWVGKGTPDEHMVIRHCSIVEIFPSEEA